MINVIKIMITILLTLMIFNPIGVFSESEQEIKDKISDIYDRQHKQAEEKLDASIKNLENKIKTSEEIFNFHEKSFSVKESNEAIDKLSKNAYTIAWKVLEAIQRISPPLCLIGLVIGAMIYHFMGPRNVHKRRYGIMLMFGSLTFLVISQVTPVVFLILINT